MSTSFGQWIRLRRRLLDLTQVDLASHVGCSPVTIRKLEADERRPSKQMAERLAQHLGIASEEMARFVAFARTASDFDALDGLPDDELLRGLSALGAPCADWGQAPDVDRFYGRAQELAQLRTWLLEDRCRLVVILGMGGIGKTSLATKLAQNVQDHFEVVIWRSLRNAPPVEEILDELLRVFSPDVALDLAPSLDRRIRRLLDHLRRQRALLILDNAEAILAEGERAGTYRDGYAGYGELLARAGESVHQSCLLVTSREIPPEIALRTGAGAPVRVFRLASLAPGDSRALLADKELAGPAESWATLNARYSGNPLVLQVVGESIRELFHGNIESFLGYETALIGSVRDLLAQQFARLSPLEQSVFIWLAVHREPVTPEALHPDLVPAPSWASLLDALLSLRRRSLVEQGQRGFTLQNVVLEFVTAYLVERIVHEVTGLEPALFQQHALLQAQARQYVRDSQTRLLIKPVVDRLVATLGRAGVEERFSAMLAKLRQTKELRSGYSAGNLVNLLVQFNGHLRGQDFSGLTVRQASLQGVYAQDMNLREAQLDRCEFSIAIQGVLAVDFSPAGDYLAIGFDTGLHCLQRLREDYPLHRQLHAGSAIWTACFSPDGQRLAAAGTDCTVWVWATESGRRLHSLEGHTAAVWAVCFSPDGSLLVSGGADSSIRMWDMQSGECLATLAHHRKGVRDLCFSPDGQILASASEDGTVSLWTSPATPEAARCVQILANHSGMVWAAAFSPDGALLATAGTDRTIRLWDTETYSPVATLTGHTHYVTDICFIPDGGLLASGSYDRTVRLWDIATARCVSTLQGHRGRVWALGVSGNVIASGGGDLSVRLWDVDPVSGSGRCFKTLQGYTNAIRSVAFSPDGALVAGAGRDTMVRLWEADTGRALITLTGHSGNLWHASFSPDGRLLVSAGHDSTIRIWDVAGGRCVHAIEKVEGCDAASFHPNGRLLATGNLDHTVDVWNVSNWELVATLRGHTSEIWALSFSPDGTRLASGSMGGGVRLWEWPSGQCLQTFQAHTSYVRSVAFSPDGALLASSAYDSTICLWDVTQPAEQASPVVVLPGPTDAAQLYVAFSPDGSFLASAGADGMVYLWEVSGARNGGPPLRTLPGHTGKVFSVAFRHDGSLLASSCDDGTIRLWDVSNIHQDVECVRVLEVELPYAHMNIAGVTGLTQAQIASLKALGAVEEN